MNDSMIPEYIGLGLMILGCLAYTLTRREELEVMPGKPMVITLCGSTKFREAYEQANRRLTLDGNIVISVGLFGHGEPEALSPDTKQMLDELHFRKIDISDAIYVLNVDGYIGHSTRNEIAYAEKTGKEVYYLENRPKVT